MLKIYLNDIRTVPDIQIFKYFLIICNTKMKDLQKESCICENVQCLNDYQIKIKLTYLVIAFVEKVQVKNENNISLISAFPLIFEDH